MIKKIIIICSVVCIHFDIACLHVLQDDLKTLTKQLEQLDTSFVSIPKKIEFKDSAERLEFLVNYAEKNEFEIRFGSLGSGFVFFMPKNFSAGERTEVRDFYPIRAYLFPNLSVKIRLRDAGKLTEDEFEKEVKYEKEANKPNYLDTAQKLAEKYKIHLMPKDDDQLASCLEKLLNEWKNNAELQQSIHVFKVRYFDIEVSQEEKDAGNILPRVVIYPASGKENAQRALNIIYKLFNGMQGADIYPRYNAKVNSLIYVAQGDADYKESSQYNFGGEIYELPKKVYYDLSKIPSKDGKDHYLRHPVTGKPIID